MPYKPVTAKLLTTRHSFFLRQKIEIVRKYFINWWNFVLTVNSLKDPSTAVSKVLAVSKEAVHGLKQASQRHFDIYIYFLEISELNVAFNLRLNV